MYHNKENGEANMKSIKRSAIAIFVVAAIFATVGCAAASNDVDSNPADSGADATATWSIPDADPVATITLLGLPDLIDGNMQPVLDAFAEAHPNITVVYQNVPFDALNAAIDAGVSAKNGTPDVYWADMPRIAALSARGYTTDVTKQFASYRDAWDDASYEGASVGDTLQGVPIANSSQILYYNKDLLDSAGVDYPSNDPNSRITWEVIKQNSKTLVADGAKNGIVFGQVDRYYQLQALPVSLGGSPGATGEGNLKPDITSEPWVKSMDFYGSLFAEGLSPRGITPEQNDQEFLDGNSAYYVQGPWFLPALNSSTINWGVALHPYFADGVPVTATGSWALAMNPFSQNKEATAIFMKWMSVDEGAGYIKYRPDAELPANKAGKDFYYAKDIFKSDEGGKAAEIIGFETGNTAVNRLSTVGYVEFESIVNRAFADIRNGTDARTALEAASTELETAWQTYK
jgi:multiple sugar transport system substrate-binding protein